MTTPEQTASQSPEDNLVETKSPRMVQQMFGEISQTYDLLNHALSLNIDKRWRRVLARETIAQATNDVLDVCGGTGDLALELANRAEKLGAAPRIICSDFTPPMMQLGRQKFIQFCKAGHTVIPHPAVADTTCLPFHDNQFDVVSVAFGIRNVVNPAEGLAEMARVCRPGGVLAVLEFSETRHPFINWGFRIYFRRILPTIGRVVTGTRAYSYLSKSVQEFPEGEEFGAMLSATTHSPTRIVRLTMGIATLYLSRKA